MRLRDRIRRRFIGYSDRKRVRRSWETFQGGEQTFHGIQDRGDIGRKGPEGIAATEIRGRRWSLLARWKLYSTPEDATKGTPTASGSVPPREPLVEHAVLSVLPTPSFKLSRPAKGDSKVPLRICRAFFPLSLASFRTLCVLRTFLITTLGFEALGRLSRVAARDSIPIRLFGNRNRWARFS